MAQSALQSGNIDLLNVIKVLKSETLTEAEHILENGLKEMQMQAQAAQQAEMQAQQAAAQEAQAQRDHETSIKQLDIDGKIKTAEKLNQGKIAVANIQADLEADISDDKIRATFDKEAIQADYKQKEEEVKLKHDKEKTNQDRKDKKEEFKAKELAKKQVKK